jgi:flagellar protein FlaG
MIIQNLSGNGFPAPLPGEGPVLPSVGTSGSAPVATTPSGQPPQGATQPAQPAAAQAQVRAAVDSINRSMQFSNRGVTFSVDPNTKETVVKVVESGTGTVIKQIPSEQALAIAQALDTMQQGMLLQHKA